MAASHTCHEDQIIPRLLLFFPDTYLNYPTMNKNLLIVLSIAMLAMACAQPEKAASEAAPSSDLKENAVTQAQLTATTPQHDLYSDGRTKLVKTANYRFEVDNVKASTDAIILALRKYPAYISASSLHLENPILENKMSIRVQNEYFHILLQDIDAQAKFVNHRDVTTEDVSKVFVDLESRLKTKREVEARYMEILRKKAGTIEELLNAEQEIGALHEEIEATISRINYLKEQVSYSTINLEFYQTITQNIQAADEKPAKARFGEALASGWQGVVAISVAIAYIWPLLLIGTGVFLFVRLKGASKSPGLK
jgi:hypothetical protein